MKFWKRTCLLLCCYGYFKELRPSEPFLTEYLTGPVHNLTEEQVLYEVYPVWTYSYMSLLVLVFLFTDFLRYKAVIVFEAVAYVATYLLLLFARGVHWMQFMEFCYGIVSATEVAYYTYMYAQVSGRYYQRVSSFTRTAVLFGRFCAGLLGQILYSTGLMDAHTLNYVSLGSFVIAFGFAVALPPVKHSIYFHRADDDQLKERPELTFNSDTGNNINSRVKISVQDFQVETNGVDNKDAGVISCGDKSTALNELEKVVENQNDDLCAVETYDATASSHHSPTDVELINHKAEESPPSLGYLPSSTNFTSKKSIETTIALEQPSQYTLAGFKKAMGLLWLDMRFAYSNEHLVRWSCWGAAATCGFLQILNYIQMLYEKVLPPDQPLYSGAIDALSTACGALATLSVAYVSVDFGAKWEWILGGVAFIQGSLLVIMGTTNSIWVVYAGFTVYRISHEFLITITGYQVARVLRSDSYGLVVGLNMFVALVMQTVLTIVVVDVMQIEIGIQFVIYGVYYAGLSLLFLTLASYRLGRYGCSAEDVSPPPAATNDAVTL
ncbi:thiamine transporter 1-like [Hyalella azteca]|uniref:Thiamine transporter 1-like n=1 Tax=Hyalella azteca TaxID=294128 RepID=A0A8B7NEV3_HYAAZ|nr:thiamine transporter 1-like [Hyalella azteca]